MLPEQILSLVQSESTSETANRLRDITGLKSVYLVPAEATDWSGWPLADETESVSSFSQILGKFAAAFVSRNLATALKMKPFDDIANPYKSGQTVKVGIAGGSTIHSLVDELRLPDAARGEACTIVPLVVGPIPETVYSAGFIAETLRKKLRVPKSKCPSISTVFSIKRGFQISMRDEVSQAREETPGQRRDNLLDLDFVITGIGSRASGQLQADLEMTYPNNSCPPNIVGDICSRIFDAQAVEIAQKQRDEFVAISFDWLKYLAGDAQTGRRVIAVAGGFEKFAAIKNLLDLSVKDEIESRQIEVLRRENRRIFTKRFLRLFNVLITDEMTATKLLRELNQKQFLQNLEHEVEVELGRNV